MTKRKSIGGLRLAALLLCLLVFFVSAFFLGRDLLRSHQEQAANDDLASQVAEVDTEADKFAADGVLLKYDKLWQQNHDMAGWLSIPDTTINYPVMYTPDQPEHYLRRGFYGEYAHSGCLFVGGGCTPDSDHVIIYGHNMKNGTMFGDLPLYAEEEYAKAHPVIQFDTLRKEQRYRVVAAFYSRVYEESAAGVFRYYQYADLSSSERFDEYLGQVRAAALYDTGAAVEQGDRLLTLSTCSYHTDDGRFVVVAVEEKDE